MPLFQFYPNYNLIIIRIGIEFDPQLVLQVCYFPGLTLVGLHVVVQLSLSLSPVGLLSAYFFLGLVQLSPHCLNSVVGLLILLLVLVSVTSLVLQLHHQLLDLLLQLPVGLGRQHPLLGLGRELLLQVAHLGLQGSNSSLSLGPVAVLDLFQLGLELLVLPLQHHLGVLHLLAVAAL